MDVLLHAIELVCIAVGAGSALIFDTFFMLSLKQHKIALHEERMLSSINFFSICSAMIGILVYAFLIALQLESGLLGALDIAFAKIFLFGITLVAGLTVRKIHLPTLLRYQKQYFHLSLTFDRHQDSLVSTGVFSITAWLFLITLTVIEQYKTVQDVHISIFAIGLAYIVLALTLSRLAIYFKNTHLS